MNISRVCKSWYRIIAGLRLLNKTTFNDCFQNGRICWKQSEHKTSPTQRHSHSCCQINDRMYLFGGLSGTSTSYNDLWYLDLNNKTWNRPATNGLYPSPKAAASLLAYNNQLVLYGGYSHPYSHPFNQQVSFFDELHIYCIDTFTWNQILFSQEAPKLAGHSASIINKNQMIFFGGCNGSLGNKTNSVYCLDLNTFEWLNTCIDSTKTFREIDGLKPECRYGHSQISLDDERILIIGGCGGPNRNFDDVWILNWPKDKNVNASWQQITINNLINSPAQLYCISFVKFDDKLITFGKTRTPVSPQTAKTPADSLSSKIQVFNPFSLSDSNECFTITGAMTTKTVQSRKCTCSTKVFDKHPISNFVTPTNDVNSLDDNQIENTLINTNDAQQMALLNKSQRNTIKRLEVLKKISIKFNKTKDEKETKITQQMNTTTSLNRTQKYCVVHSHLMQMFILDIKQLMNEMIVAKPIVNWQTPIAHFYQAPPDTILYSLVIGVDEIILFGGMESDSPLKNQTKNCNDYSKNRISNKMYVMKPFV